MEHFRLLEGLRKVFKIEKAIRHSDRRFRVKFILRLKGIDDDDIRREQNRKRSQ